MSRASPPTNPALVTLPPEIEWSEFPEHFQWEQGEHVTLIGPTGQGKTTLALKLLPLRAYVLIFAAKRRDHTMDRVLREGYEKQAKFHGDVANRIVLWPEAKSIDDVHHLQRERFHQALNEVYFAGGWCVYLDEATYIASYLGLDKDLAMLWQQGRSLGVSIVAATQRPAYIPLYAYDQATHLFFWRDTDSRNLDRISGLGGLDGRNIRAVVPQLKKHEVLYVNTRTGEMLTTKPEV